MDESKLQRIMSQNQRAGSPEIADLARAILDLNSYVPSQINDNITLTGNTMATTTTYLQFGLNVINTASISANSCKLPYPPVKGKQVIVINNSGYPIQIFPSTEGGSINNAINGLALIPSDGKSYTFYCWENPLPGAWSWTPPATNQYDSGVITFNSPGGNNIISPATTGVVTTSTAYLASGSAAVDSLNNPAFRLATGGAGVNAYYIKPATVWNQINRIKIYTNLIYFDSTNVTFRLAEAHAYNYYLAGTTTSHGFTGQAATGLTSDIDIDQWVGSTPTPALPVLATNIGDSQTMYVDHALSLPAGLINSFGDTYLGQVMYNNKLCDKYYSRTLSLQMMWRDVELTGAQVRFFIEYN